MQTPGGCWTSDQEKQKYDMMNMERQTQLGTSRACFGSLRKHPVLEQFLGKRRGHRTRVGLTLSQSAFRYAEGYQSALETYTTLEDRARIQRLENQVTLLTDLIRQHIPGI